MLHMFARECVHKNVYYRDIIYYTELICKITLCSICSITLYFKRICFSIDWNILKNTFWISKGNTFRCIEKHDLYNPDIHIFRLLNSYCLTWRYFVCNKFMIWKHAKRSSFCPGNQQSIKIYIARAKNIVQYLAKFIVTHS